THQPWGRQRHPATGDCQPRDEMSETPGEIIVEVELPVQGREDVRIEVKEDFLHITGERRPAAVVHDGQYHRLHRGYGRFARQLRLPSTVAREGIRAEFDAGILIITLPKHER